MNEKYTKEDLYQRYDSYMAASKTETSAMARTARDLLHVYQASPELFEDEHEMLPMMATLERVIKTYGNLISADSSMEEESEQLDERVSGEESEEEPSVDMDVQSNEQVDQDTQYSHNSSGSAAQSDIDPTCLPINLFSSQLCGTYNLEKLRRAMNMLASMEGPDQDPRIALALHNLYRIEDAFYDDKEQDPYADHKE